MAVQAQYLAYVLEQLSRLSAVRSNRMFGGIGLYSDAIFFGLIDDDTLYFKTGPANVEQYQARKMPKFMPFPDKTGAVMGYHQVPADVIEDAETLVAWARQSVAVQLSAKAAKPAAPRKKAAPPKQAGTAKHKQVSKPKKGKPVGKPKRNQAAAQKSKPTAPKKRARVQPARGK